MSSGRLIAPECGFLCGSVLDAAAVSAGGFLVMLTGMVKWFDSKKGYGFITGSEEGKDIFVHYTHIEGDGFRSLKDGDRVEFDLVDSDKGPQAHHVRRAENNAEASAEA